MNINEFDYTLPPELIASRPAETRSASRMLTLNRESGEIEHKRFTDLPDYLNAGDCLVINDTKVFPARLLGGHRVSGGAVEIFLIRRLPNESGGKRSHWRALAKPSARLSAGESIVFEKDGVLVGTVTLGEYHDEGVWDVSFSDRVSEGRILDHFGTVPLPPYIGREADSEDTVRYQTVYADSSKSEAVAAPTAGLHFTEEILADLEKRGVIIVRITLNVGPGTFKPVVVESIAEHTVDPEWAEISGAAAGAINTARAQGKRVIAVGTTVARTLESAALKAGAGGAIESFSGMVDLYIQPGSQFAAVDALLTNFHLPKSSLLILVSAFAGYELTMRAYQIAVKERYRFYSYGDCMFIYG